jgi:hypothetical protein
MRMEAINDSYLQNVQPDNHIIALPLVPCIVQGSDGRKRRAVGSGHARTTATL